MHIARVNEGTLKEPEWVELKGDTRKEVFDQIRRRVSRANRSVTLSWVIPVASGIVLGLIGFSLTSKPIETILLLGVITSVSFFAFDAARNMRRTSRWPSAEIREVHD